MIPNSRQHLNGLDYTIGLGVLIFAYPLFQRSHDVIGDPDIGLIQDWEDLLGRKIEVTTENGLHPLIKDRVIRGGYIQDIAQCIERTQDYTREGREVQWPSSELGDL